MTKQKPQTKVKSPKLLQILVDRGLKQLDLIDLLEETIQNENLNISLPQNYIISNICTGKRLPSTKILYLLSKALNVTMEDLLDTEYVTLKK